MHKRMPQVCRQCPRVRSMDEAANCHASPARKMHIRRAVAMALGSMSPEIKRQKSLAIVRRLLAHPVFQSARTIMGYIAMETEVDLWTLFREAWMLGKTIALPRIVPPLDEPRITRVHDRRILPYQLTPAAVDAPSEHPGLQMDMLGIWEPKSNARPVPLAEVDLILVPCLAYDRRGVRMGKGGGFYDRLLASDGVRATTAGIAFSEQIFRRLPSCPHDHPVNMLFTDCGLTDFSSRSLPITQQDADAWPPNPQKRGTPT